MKSVDQTKLYCSFGVFSYQLSRTTHIAKGFNAYKKPFPDRTGKGLENVDIIV